MQILAAAAVHALQGDCDEIAAMIGVVGGMERLVDIADQVHHPFQRLIALTRRSTPLAQHRNEPLELLCIALAIGTVPRLVSGTADRQVIIVPCGTIRPGTPHLVCPHRHRFESRPTRGVAELVLVIRQDLQHDLMRRRSEESIGDCADGAMTLGPPGQGRLRAGEQNSCRNGGGAPHCQHVTVHID